MLAQGKDLGVWTWAPGVLDAATLSRLASHDATTHPGYKPEFTGIDGTMVAAAAAWNDPATGIATVTVRLTSDGAARLEQVTTDRLAGPAGTPDNLVAIFLDGHLVEDAQVQSAITSGQLLVAGSFTAVAAGQLAFDLNRGQLPGKLELLSTTPVSGL